MTPYIQVITATDSEESAKSLVNLLITNKLAACVQISEPITSTYTWNGEITESKEWQVTAKTLGNLYEEVETFITENHSYEIPEILAVPIVNISPKYASWMEEQLR